MNTLRSTLMMATAMVAFGTSALAQTESASDSEETARTFDTIQVTAQRRSEISYGCTDCYYGKVRRRPG